MSHRILTIDDCIDVSDQNLIESSFLSEKFPWYFSNSANWGNKNNGMTLGKKSLECIDGVKDSPQLIHNIFADNLFSKHFESSLSVKILSAIPFSIKQLLRIKANLTYPTNVHSDHLLGVPHIDFVEENLITAIYYVNNSDGDTIIFNERFQEKEYKDLTISQTIKPKKGRLVVFNGNYIHAGTLPSNNSARIVINFNLIPHKSN
jgi:hypothetical protein